MAEMIFPNSFVRQFSGPLDTDLVFSTTTTRTNYLTSARRYPGQIVSDLQDGKAYKLNIAGTNWEEFGSVNSYTGTDVKLLTANWQNTYYTVSALSAAWGTGSGVVSGAYLPLSGGTVTGSVTVTGTVFAQSFVLTTPGLIVFDTVSAAAIPVTTLPIIGNDVELYTTAAVTITAFENGIKGTTYTLTNKGTGTVTITASPTNFVRNGTSWRSNTRALSTAFLELPTNYSCSLRADINNVVSVW